MSSHAVFEADQEQLDSMLAWVRDCIAQAGFGSSDALKIELAMEEALINVINYAYKSGKGETIELKCKIDPGKQIEFTVIDKGIPFNPLMAPPPLSVNQTLEERVEGGLGIFFIRSLMDEVHYERLHPFNILVLNKKFINK